MRYTSFIDLPYRYLKHTCPKSIARIGQNNNRGFVSIMGLLGPTNIFADSWLDSCVEILFPDLVDSLAGYFMSLAISLVVTPVFFSRIILWINFIFRTSSSELK
jgi:hypothetical protein